MISAECDKSIKIWQEDENATPETHPIVQSKEYYWNNGLELIINLKINIDYNNIKMKSS